jgi:hypothetical protein
MKTPTADQAEEPRPQGQSVNPRSFADIAESRTAGPHLAVRFLRRWTVYFAGDYATFPQRMAMRLVREGYGEPVNPGQGTPPPDAIMATRYPVPIEERRRRGE